ncbi:hypothetical protein LZ318_02980 [Saccharopolyspora indica]|uniref:hypothetical protein n=1 Tax=Saccharopolyspora indica TaxID=1229659 RepID=UPI0022EB063C|nr:hypothetical protein [Saccharopolyspora indica]MDA3649440.1 hypothetical protein [Saccharopolyspora indica]
MRWRRLSASALVACLLPVVTGCFAVRSGAEEPALPSAAAQLDGVEVWDLRTRPTSVQAGTVDRDVAIYETRPSRPVLVRLPDGAELRLAARFIAFDAHGSRGREPSGVEAKTEMMPLAETVEVYRSTLQQLGLPTGAVADFERAAADATGTEWVRMDRVGGESGDFAFGVQARYSPAAGAGLVVVGGSWRIS